MIGGGIFGLFCALTLADAGKSVVVIDRGPVWSEASAVNAGSLGVQNKLPALVPYTLWSWEIWETLAERLGADIGLRRDGGYKIAMTEAEAERLDAVSMQQKALGLDVRRLTQADLRRTAPWISSDCVAATYSPQDGYANPTLVGPALRRAVERSGVEILDDTAVEEIRSGDRLGVVTRRGEIQASKIAITSGAWSGRLAAMVGVRLPISLDVNMVSVTESARPTIENIVTHARGILTLKQVANGSCLIGGGWQGIGTLENQRKEVSYDQLVHNLRLALRVIPGLERLNVVRSWAGYEGVTPDSLPYLGLLPGHRNIYCAACARGGFTLGPLMGQLLGELISHGETSKPIDIFNPGRFAHVAA
ncbi:FAD-binding oxidoreductase [Pseudaminobacter sp. 19-2017]|uniref:FAD-binding oxidoreductase n=1 Tax=Pseudaminobacter soli (ex Zhang et al. 2022) TaxID=2831468 RepID=A0A942DYC8_9HYPH|nr:FAD-binding oxidoreductase [Pseudaminobacter soli]